MDARERNELRKRIGILTEFLQDFEAPGVTFGAWSKAEQREPGVISMPHFGHDPVAQRFISAAYAHGWVKKDFDWPSWQDEAQRLVIEPARLAKADIFDIERLLTTHIRKERFCEGHLASMFDCGHLTAVLKRLRDLAETRE